MPTSSQAMILRGNDGTGRTRRINYKALTPILSKSGASSGRVSVDLQTQSPRGNCELVKFDFRVSTTDDCSLDGFRGMFAFDQNTKTYRWKICSVVPKRSPERQVSEMQGGDFINEEQFVEENISGEQKIKTDDSFINRQSSDHTRHFTTPVVSLTDNSNFPVSQSTELYGKSPPLSSLNIPHDTNAIDETSYRRLEGLGFRRRTAYRPGGGLMRLKHGESPLQSPRKSRSPELAATSSVPTLTISSLDTAKVPRPAATPYKIQGFQPKPFATGDSMRKRVRPEKQKSLLQEVKECVQWERRVTPSSHGAWRHQPGFMPTAICFSLRDGWQYTHSEIKAIVEEQLQSKVQSLRYDPVSIRNSEEGCLDRWIVTFATKANCDSAVQKGLAVDGDIVVVRAWDDVLRDEYITDRDELDWDYPCSFRLQSERHKRVLQKFLQVN